MIFKRNFLYKVMPSLDDIHADKYVEDIIVNFANSEYSKGMRITDQDEVQDKLHFLREGSCLVEYKTLSGRTVKLVEIGVGSILGEECLFSAESKSTFTTIVISQKARFLTLTKKYCQKSIPLLTLQSLKIAYDLKERARFSYITRVEGEGDLG
jgi:CRP-like cAMP-binding protein